MTSHADLVEPPRLAVWLITLFAPTERAESICGDLLEEFAQLASRSDVPSTRRWFRRQTLRTVVHLIAAEVRASPWRHTATVVTGLAVLLSQIRFVIPTVEAVLETFHVYEYLVETAGDVPSVEVGNVYFSWIMRGEFMGRLLVETLIGGLVTVTTKGRNLTAAVVLGLLLSVAGAVGSLAMLANTEYSYYVPLFTVPTVFAHSIVVVLGGVLVRKLGQRVNLRPSAS